MKEEVALNKVSGLKSFIGRKVYTINGGEYTIQSFYSGLQKDSLNQYDVYITLSPTLVTVVGQVKTESFDLFRSTYSVLETIEIRVDAIEEINRLCLFVPGEFDYDAVQFSTAGNNQFPQKSLASFPSSKPGMKCEVFEISKDLKRYTRSESGRLWASLTVNGITYISNALSFAKINSA